MIGKTLVKSATEGTATNSDQDSMISVLAVGEATEWAQQGNVLPGLGITFVSFSDINEAMLGHLSPSVIFSPVLAASFDCIDLSLLLHNLGYSGAYRAIARQLPKPDLIEREVKQICPRLDFRIVIAS